MKTGKIKVLKERGFGFIEYEGADKDLFFHSSELKNVAFDSLKVGDEVTFEIGDGPKGQNAININK